MIAQIKKDLEQLLNNYKVVNLDNKNDIQQNIQQNIQQKVDNYLYSNYNNYDYKVVCDQTNNINEDFTFVDVYITSPTPTYTILNVTVVKIKEDKNKKIK